MSNLYNVKLKIGKRNYSTKLYASNYEKILTFVSNNLQSEVVSIEQIVYEAPSTQSYPIDDPLTYKGAMYFMLANKEVNKVKQVVMQTIKKSRTVEEVFSDMKSLLELDNISGIKSLLSVNISSK